MSVCLSVSVYLSGVLFAAPGAGSRGRFGVRVCWRGSAETLLPPYPLPEAQPIARSTSFNAGALPSDARSLAASSWMLPRGRSKCSWTAAGGAHRTKQHHAGKQNGFMSNVSAISPHVQSLSTSVKELRSARTAVKSAQRRAPNSSGGSLLEIEQQNLRAKHSRM